MTLHRSPLSAAQWMRQIFSAKTALDGGIVRRKTADVDRIIGKEKFLDEVERRGFRALENNGQILIVCNTDPVRILR